MILQVLASRAEIRAAFDAFKRALTSGIRPIRRHIGYQGGGAALNVYWLPQHRIWCALEPEFVETRYWCAFGLEDPRSSHNLSITCEINSPIAGVDRRVAGAFLADARGGQLSVAHSGRIGGGRKGIGQTAFLSLCRCADVPVVFADGQTSNMLLVGAIRSAKFRAEVAYFVREVDRVKALLVDSDAAPPPPDKFTPEFAGKRRPYVLNESVESVATHGLVVGELAATLERQGLAPRNDRYRDLYLGPPGQPTHLFEIKTDVTTSSIYAGVGQLMLHGGDGRDPRKVLVLPDRPTLRLSEQLKSLQIAVVTYGWKGAQPVLGALTQVL